jgi:hypothetical protein
MSADDWSECPFCKKEGIKEQTLRIDGWYDYYFDHEGNLVIGFSGWCTQCKRIWRVCMIVKPSEPGASQNGG